LSRSVGGAVYCGGEVRDEGPAGRAGRFPSPPPNILAFKVSLDSHAASLPALDDEYRLVVNHISFTDLL